MTRPSTKRHERSFVEQAGKLLGQTWTVGPDREGPDFILDEGPQRFGLEVVEIFTGPQDQNGSAMKRRESEVQEAVNSLRREYEATTSIPLCVRLVGNMCSDNIAGVVPALIATDFSVKAPGYRVVIDEGNGLRVHVTRAFRADWFSVNDRVGWVDRNPIPRIAGAVEEKSRKLVRYLEAVGTDVRLLVVANRNYNSGKLRLKEEVQLDRQGFRIVYFLSYPEDITIFG